MEKDGIDSSGRKRKKLYQACREHNIRDPKYCDKQEHIVKGGLHETWIDIPSKQGTAVQLLLGKGKEIQRPCTRKGSSYYNRQR